MQCAQLHCSQILKDTGNKIWVNRVPYKQSGGSKDKWYKIENKALNLWIFGEVFFVEFVVTSVCNSKTLYKKSDGLFRFAAETKINYGFPHYLYIAKSKQGFNYDRLKTEFIFFERVQCAHFQINWSRKSVVRFFTRIEMSRAAGTGRQCCKMQIYCRPWLVIAEHSQRFS